MKRKTLYTTSEYVKALEPQCDGNLYECIRKNFQLFTNKGAAEYDADWWVKYWRVQGKKVRRPTIYKIKLERVK